MNAASGVNFRLAVAADLPALRAIYAASVTAMGPSAYTPKQVAVWREFAEQAGFEDSILAVNTFIACLDDDNVGFCGIADDGHVASVYVRPDRCGKGIGGALLSEAMVRHPAPSCGRYYAEASRFSLPLFLRYGFDRTGTEQVERNGVAFERFLVARSVDSGHR